MTSIYPGLSHLSVSVLPRDKQNKKLTQIGQSVDFCDEWIANCLGFQDPNMSAFSPVNLSSLIYAHLTTREY